jgi:hypothetical protein
MKIDRQRCVTVVDTSSDKKPAARIDINEPPRKRTKLSESIEHFNQLNAFTSNDNNEDQRIAWLMSFPNSGTSYTSYLIRTVTLTNTASNYGHESVTELSALLCCIVVGCVSFSP